MQSKKIPRGIDFIIFGFFLSLYILICRGDYFSMDEMGRFGLTKTLVLEHDLSITKPDGTSFYVPWPILQSVAAVPLYVFGELVSGSADPAQRLEVGKFFVSLFCPIVSALCCVVFFRLCRQLKAGLRSSLLMTLVFGLCTIVLPYSRTFFSEPLTGLLLMAGALFAITSTKEKPVGGILSGLFLALAVANNYVALPVIGFAFVLFAFQSEGTKGAIRIEALKDIRLWGLGLCVVAAIAENLWYNHALTGMYFRSPYYYLEYPENPFFGKDAGLFSYPLLAGLQGLLLSPLRSVFLYSPPLIGALIMWRRFIKNHRETALFLFSIPVLYLLVHSKFLGWHGGYAWGPRYLVPVTGFLLLPFMYLIKGFSRLRAANKVAVIALIASGLYIQLLPTVLLPAASYVEVLEKYGGLSNEIMIQYLPQACSIVVQTKLLGTINSVADIDLYFLNHLDSGIHLTAMGALIVLLVATAILYFKAIRRSSDFYYETI